MAHEKAPNTPIPSDTLIGAITGSPTAIRPEALDFARRELDAHIQTEQDDAAQIVDMLIVEETADRVEEYYRELGIPLPTVFIVYTAGFEPPKNIVQPVRYGKGMLKHILPSDIEGHTGMAGALKFDEKHSGMAFVGRAHPYAGAGRRYAEMEYARMLNTVKELARRQRDRGIQSAVILTYLVGADDSTALQKKDIGVVIDVIEMAGGRAGLSAGGGPRNILDTYYGSRFQARLGRASDAILARTFFDLAKKRGITVGAAAAVGTPGTTNFQSLMDRGLGLAPFERMQHNLDSMARKIFGRGQTASLLFDMAMAFEADVMKQTISRPIPGEAKPFVEQDIPLLILGLPTDMVGRDSADVSHNMVVEEATQQGNPNGDLVLEFATKIAQDLTITHPLQEIPIGVDPGFSLAWQLLGRKH